MLVAEENFIGEVGTMTYRFTATTRRDADLARTARLHHDVFVRDVTGFSGAAVKHSPVLHKVIAWDLVP